MATIRRLWLPGLALCCGACVSVGEPVLVPQAIAKSQRTILLVYPAPAPWVITDSESKAEAAAKMLPGISYAVSSFQEDRYKAAADTLAKYVPRWPSRDLLEAALLKELAKTDFPGRFIPVAEAEADTATLRGWNRSSDVLDWQNRYISPNPALPHPRDYSRFLAWDDALVLEVNLLPLLSADDDGNMIPTLNATSRMFRCQTMHPLWKHEDQADDPASARTLYEFETLPQQLLDRWKALVPALASKISASLYASLHPGAQALGTAVSTGTAAGMPRPAVSTGTRSFALPPAVSTATAPTAVSSATITAPALPAVSTGTISAAAPALSTSTVQSPPPAVSSPTVAVPVLPGVSSGTISGAAPAVSTAPAVAPPGLPAP
ncbi:MAG: hypothetical protein NTY77_19355 [Elusimicrobia bacterium]|nr:hypothetical protein [Elusimicrobiota bacterium]